MDSKDRILIVDDDPGIRRLLVDYLAKNGFEPVAARLKSRYSQQSLPPRKTI